LNDDTLSNVERRENFQAFLHAVTAFDRTALFTLGPYANTIERSEIDVFLESFKASLTSRVQLRLEALRDFTLAVTGSTDRTADDSIVMIDVISAGSSSLRDAQAAFRVRENAEGDPVIIDIQFEGIWLGIVAREVNMSYLAHNDGNLNELSGFLDEQRRASVLSSFLDEQSQISEAENRITN
jgi:ABC-type transporter MlaC component